MDTYYNPALYEEPRNQPITVVPPMVRESLFGWLESSGRFKNYEPDEFHGHKVTEDLDDILEPEIYAAESEEEQSD